MTGRGGRKGHPYESVIRGAVQDRRATARVTPTEGLQKARLVVACRIRIHTHIHYIHPQKPCRVCRPQAAKKFKSFFTATCAWGKIPLRLPVWNFVACDKIMRAADCKPLWQKIPTEFSASKKRGARRRLFFVVSRLYLTCCTGPYRRQPSRQRYRRASYQQQHESPAE